MSEAIHSLLQRPGDAPVPGAFRHGMATGKRTVIDEQTLIKQVKDGDAQAFEELYRRHVNRVYALCLRMTGNQSDAEDRTQETFVKAWQKIDAFQGNSAFGTWIHRIAVNLLISAHRKRVNQDRHEKPLDGDHPFSQKSAVDGTPERMDLESALARLPEGARVAFLLHNVEGYKHEEIATLTGMAVGTSKAQSHRARKLLREMLA